MLSGETVSERAPIAGVAPVSPTEGPQAFVNSFINECTSRPAVPQAVSAPQPAPTARRRTLPEPQPHGLGPADHTPSQAAPSRSRPASNRHDLELPGCTPEPPMAYLKARGGLRLVSERNRFRVTERCGLLPRPASGKVIDLQTFPTSA